MNIEFVTAVPSSPYPAGTCYFVAVGGDHFEMYTVTKDKQNLRRVFNESDVNKAIKKEIAAIGAVEIVATIAARDALTLTGSAVVLVTDASTDTTVAAGAATYAYQHSNKSWTKISEYESMDVALSWSNLTGKPSATPAEIDATVDAKHAHANKSQLDKIGQSADGTPQYNGANIVTSAAPVW